MPTCLPLAGPTCTVQPCATPAFPGETGPLLQALPARTCQLLAPCLALPSSPVQRHGQLASCGRKQGRACVWWWERWGERKCEVSGLCVQTFDGWFRASVSPVHKKAEP